MKCKNKKQIGHKSENGPAKCIRVVNHTFVKKNPTKPCGFKHYFSLECHKNMPHSLLYFIQSTFYYVYICMNLPKVYFSLKTQWKLSCLFFYVIRMKILTYHQFYQILMYYSKLLLCTYTVNTFGKMHCDAHHVTKYYSNYQ